MKIRLLTLGDAKSVHIDLEELPKGQTYEDRYQGYLEVFKRIAELDASIQVVVRNPPWSWVPLLQNLRAEIQDPRVDVFPHCAMVRGAVLHGQRKIGDRTALEVLCSFRPETVDALWKCDMQWNIPEGRRIAQDREKEFIVTNNGSFHRAEVKQYISELRQYTPPKKKVVLVPCAADKPYPSPMHQAVLDRMPDDYYLMNATGVVGLVPQEMWSRMPHYDSGIPNQWRLLDILSWYFDLHHHDRVIVYCDFYSETIFQAFYGDSLFPIYSGKVRFVLPVMEYNDYVDLLQPDRLKELEKAFLV